MHSGERIRTARERLPGRNGKHLSRETLAQRAGIVTSTLQKWEREGLPYGEEYARLADALGVTLDELIRGDDPAAEAALRAAGDSP